MLTAITSFDNLLLNTARGNHAISTPGLTLTNTFYVKLSVTKEQLKHMFLHRRMRKKDEEERERKMLFRVATTLCLQFQRAWPNFNEQDKCVLTLGVAGVTKWPILLSFFSPSLLSGVFTEWFVLGF